MSNDEINRLIGKIRERYDQIHEPSGNIIRIEADLLRADIRELYEKISILTKPQYAAVILQSHLPESEKREEEAPILVEPVSAPEFVPEPKPEIFSPDPIPESIFEIETQEETASPVVLQTPAQRPANENAPEVQMHETTTPVHSTLDLFGAPTPMLADKFRDEKRSINEKINLETTAEKSIGSKLRLKISDLRTAIGINDRFIFINELFEGNMRMYDDMLGRINTCASLQEAIDVFKHAKDVQGWSDDLNSAERLLDFIHRRYA